MTAAVSLRIVMPEENYSIGYYWIHLFFRSYLIFRLLFFSQIDGWGPYCFF